MTPEAVSLPTVVSAPLLRERLLPAPGAAADKEARGRALVIGGSDETPGALLLAGLAALRAGAGKLQLAAPEATAVALAVAVPEARVVPLPSVDGCIDASRAGGPLGPLVGCALAVLVGPGAMAADATGDLLASVVGAIGDETALVLDAAALPALADRLDVLTPVASRAVVMPNPSEAGRLLGRDTAAVLDDLDAAHAALVERLGCVVALRAADTLIGAPGTHPHLDRSGHPALGTSGSGDVLAGLLIGLLARGTDPLDAALWAVHLHGRTGELAAAEIGGQGILARELIDEIPRALVAVSGATT